MPRSRPQLAKITRPRLHGVVPRRRLYRALDEARRRAAVWVVGPPGAGKTTLVASWLDARRARCVWYQLDPGDADPATFFYYLGLAARSFSRPGKRPLPLLTPEYGRDLCGFARRYFRELFSRLGKRSVIVLDNVQEVPDDSTLDQVMASAIDEVPGGSCLLAVSRAEPGQTYARPKANQLLALVDWDHLKLTPAEVRAIVRARVRLDRRAMGKICEVSGGWAAGLVLLIERLRRGGHIEDLGGFDSLREVFAYFAGQFFDRLTEPQQLSLLRLSYLPRVSGADVEPITGSPDASRMLEHLYRRGLFVDLRPAPVATYQFHPLFLAFLQHRAATRFSAARQVAAIRRAAHVLEARGHAEEALELHLRGGDLAAAEALVLEGAGRARLRADRAPPVRRGSPADRRSAQDRGREHHELARRRSPRRGGLPRAPGSRPRGGGRSATCHVRVCPAAWRGVGIPEHRQPVDATPLRAGTA